MRRRRMTYLVPFGIESEMLCGKRWVQRCRALKESSLPGTVSVCSESGLCSVELLSQPEQRFSECGPHHSVSVTGRV